MSTPYQPELGQAVFGQPFKEYELPALWEAVLYRIRCELDRVWWNVKQKDMSSPFDNSGAEPFICDAFEVHSYSWGDDEQPYNFKCGDVEISWYKHSGRGQSINVEPTPELAQTVLRKCILALAQWEWDNDDEDMRWRSRPDAEPA